MTHLVVGGAGIGGLAAALALASGSVRVTILERRPALAEFGAGLQLSPNAARVLTDLNLLDAVQAVALEPESVRIRRGRDAADVVRFPLGHYGRHRYGAPFLLVLRPALQRVLAARAASHPNIDIRFSCDVESVSPDLTGTVRIAMGSDRVRADGFVDARGAAAIRTRPSGRTAWRALVPAGGLDPDHLGRDTNLWLGPRTHLVHYRLPDGERVNVVAITEERRQAATEMAADPWSRPGDPDVLRQAFAGWHPHARQLLDREAQWRRWPLFDAPPVPHWTEGNVTRLGDAAHPMLPFLAQGASQAIEDAGALGRCMVSASSVADAFVAYEGLRRGRATRVQQASRRQGEIYHLRRPLADARDAALRLMGGARALARMDWLYGAG